MADNILKRPICSTLETNYMPYAMSVIISRAIPEIDGFKPSHRKLLYTMYKMGLLSGARTKSANVVGQTMKLNPHGEGAIYETMVRLTRGNEALLHPFVDSKGNFGKQYSRDMAYAASRYTEVKLDAICSEVFRDIDKNTVSFMDNYDGTTKEPMLLPVAYPTILVNPNQGIAVGMASNICSFNLREVCEATCAYLKDEEADLLSYIKAPDFSTGGELIYKQQDMQSIFETGRGSFKVRAKYRYDKKVSCIEIYEIPYTTTAESIIDKIIELIRGNKIKDITDIRDETDINGLKITIDIRKSADPDQIMNKLYRYTPLEDSFGCNFNILIEQRPVVLGIRAIIEQWCKFRMECVRSSLLYEKAEKESRLHLLNALKKILLDIDKAIAIIRHTKQEDQVIPNLMDGFGIDMVQAEYVAEIKLRNLNEEYIIKRLAEIDGLLLDIERIEKVLQSPREMKKVMIGELTAIAKKHGKDRRTTIIDQEHIEAFSDEHLIEDYSLRLFMTKDNYMKKISLVSLRGASEQKLKPGDEMICELEASNKDDVLLFSDKSQVYKMKIHELPDCKASALGDYLPNLLDLAPDEKIIYMTSTKDYSGFMLFAFENGKVAKVPMESYATKTNRKRLTGAYSSAVPVVSILHLLEEQDIVLISRGNHIMVCDTQLISLKASRGTLGVQVYKAKRDKFLASMQTVAKAALAQSSAYKVRTIPNAGQKPKGEDAPVQLNLFTDEEQE